MRESESYRPILESVLAFADGRHILNVTEIMSYTGRGREWCKAHLNIKKAGLTAEELAMALSRMR